MGSTTEVAGNTVVGAPNAVRPATIFDFSGAPPAIVDVVVSVLVVFDFSLWSAETKAAALPNYEETNRVVPREEQYGFGPTRRAIRRNQ